MAMCLAVPVVCAIVGGLDLGYAAGLYAGSQTISAAIGVATDQIQRLGYTAERGPDRAHSMTGAVPASMSEPVSESRDAA